MTFPELVHSHKRWRQALDGEIGHQGEAEDDYRTALAAFERVHGNIVNSYWCTSVESAVALTARPRSRLLRVLGAPDAVRFHRVSDWATKDHPEIAEPLHECDEIAIKASEVLVGKSRIVAMQLVMASAAHLLSLVDERSGHGTAAKTRRALTIERKELTQTLRYFHQAANGEAQIVYVFGMTLGIGGLGVLAAVLALFVGFGGIDGRELFGCLIAGGLGALVSVMSRISAGRFHLASDFGAKYPLFLGLLRPLIGAIFGLVIYFALAGGLVKIFNLPKPGIGETADNDRLYFYAAMAFLAGFSERWARDMLLGPSGLSRGGAQTAEGPVAGQESGNNDRPARKR